MKRPTLVRVVILLQILLGLVLAGFTIYLMALTRSREILAEPDAAGTIHGLLIGAAVLGIPAIVTLIAAAGLWKGKLWGWVLSLATDVGVLCVFAYSMFDDRMFDQNEMAMAAGFVVAGVLLLVPAVRKFYWCDAEKSF